MNTADLRIGNHIKYGNDEYARETVVKELYMAMVNTDDGIDTFYDHSDQFYSIPITEDWLLRLGFSKCDSKFADYPQLLSIQISNTEYLQYEDDEFFIASVSGHQVVTLWHQPKYIHQIQNIYFALTGEELTIIDL